MPDLQILSSTVPGAVLLAAGTTIGLASIDRSSDARTLALFLAITGVVVMASSVICRTIRAVNRPADQAYNDGYEAGYDKGWLEGRAGARPKVITMTSARSGVVAADRIS